MKHRTFVAALAMLAAGCAHGGVARGVADAQRHIATGDLAGADSALVACSAAHPSDDTGAQCRYRLVLVRLDPASPGPSRGAVEAAREYLARDVAAPGRDEMMLLVRIATERERMLDLLESSRNTLATRATDVQTPLRDDGALRLQTELEKLRAELARTQDELQRIKRRLSAPRP
jgi:hypothetical protein